jgi:hypothetical protein
MHERLDSPCPPYENWPASLPEREAHARELLGRHLIAAYDNWLNTAAKMLFEGDRYKSPTREQQAFLDWIASLPEADRQNAFAFVRQIAHGVVFSILNRFDGTSGSFLQDKVWEQLRVVVDIYPRADDPHEVPDELVESLSINTQESRERGIELHELWYEWQEKYSRWHRDP